MKTATHSPVAASTAFGAALIVQVWRLTGRHVPRNRAARDEVARHAGDPEAEQQRPDEPFVDAGDLLEQGTDVRVRGEVAGHEQERDDDAGQHGTVAELVGELGQAQGLLFTTVLGLRVRERAGHDHAKLVAAIDFALDGLRA